MMLNEYETFNPLLNIGGVFCILLYVALMYTVIYPISIVIIKSCFSNTIELEGGEIEQKLLDRIAKSFYGWLKRELFFTVIIRTV